MAGRIFILSIAAALLVGGLTSASALPVAPLNTAKVGDADQVIQVRAGEKRAGGNKNVNVNKRTNVNKNVRVNKNVNVNRNVRVNKNVNVHRNVNVNRNVNVRRNVYVNGRRPYYRSWARRPYYGTVIGGVALGTVIGVSAAYAVPSAPAPNMCWYWSDRSGMHGYWDYCVAP
jgi:hypothetical protein